MPSSFTFFVKGSTYRSIDGKTIEVSEYKGGFAKFPEIPISADSGYNIEHFRDSVYLDNDCPGA